MVERLCEPCRDHFKKVLELLDDLGYPYLLNPYLVRGLDYYNRTVFEIFPEFPAGNSGVPVPTGNSGVPVPMGNSDAPVPRGTSGVPAKTTAIAGGGRYDYLVEMIGGPETDAVGSAIGVERAIAAFKQGGGKPPLPQTPSVFLVQLGDLARTAALKMIEEFRKADIGLATSLGRDSIKAQLKAADRLGVAMALIIGHKEAVDGNVILRDMQSGAQETIPASQIIEAVKDRMKKAKR
jgi:histidyl-tRNA synthetase